MSEELSEFGEEEALRLITYGKGVYFQHHKPTAMTEPYHVHASIEVNFLKDCEMVYSFSGQQVHIPKNRFCVFWAARPHRTIKVIGNGSITNAYVSLEEFWSWPLSQDFRSQLLAGSVLLSNNTAPCDGDMTKQWANERHHSEPSYNRLHCLELQARMTRLAIEGWTVATAGSKSLSTPRIGGNAVVHFDKMLRYISLNSSNSLTLDEVAASASVSRNYANTVFKKILGTTVKAQITEIRVHRAKTLLTETDDKILSIALDCGFRSQSSFYEAFQAATGKTPATFRDESRGTVDADLNAAAAQQASNRVLEALETT